MVNFDPPGYQRIERALDRINLSLNNIDRRITLMAGELDALKAAVAKLDTVESSIVALVKGLAQQIKDLVAAGADPAALTALANDISAKADEMAQVVTDNTPAAS